MPWVKVKSEEPEGRTMGQEVGRQLGLTARAAIEGVGAIPMLAGDAVNLKINHSIGGINKMFGTDIPMLRPVTESSQVLLDQVFPKPETGLERVVNVGSAALSGAGAAKKLAQEAASAAPKVTRSVAEFLADAPMMQTAGAVAGTMGTEAAQKIGVEDPRALALIGMTTGAMVPGGGGTAAKRTGTGLKGAVSPFTEKGKELIVGRSLNRLANDPENAANNAASAAEIVPGSRPTLPQAAGDVGLAAADSAVRGMDENGTIPARMSEQNAARMDEMDRIARDRGTLDQATAKRDSTYEDFAEPAFRAKQPVPITPESNPVLDKIAELRASKAGNRETVRKALDYAEGLITREGADLTDAESLYEIRKDLALARDGKLSANDRADLKLAKRELSDVIDVLDNQIEIGAPGYREYLSLYAKRSVPLEQLQALQEIRSRAVLSASDPATGRPVLSNGKFQTLLRSNMTKGLRLAEGGPKGAKLSDQQLATLDRIAADLDRGAATTAGTVRSPGSDSFKNMSIANLIGRILGDDLGAMAQQTGPGKAMMTPLNFLYRVPEQDIQLMLLEAWTDPEFAARLMRQASQTEVENIAKELGRRTGQASAANALYSE